MTQIDRRSDHNLVCSARIELHLRHLRSHPVDFDMALAERYDLANAKE